MWYQAEIRHLPTKDALVGHVEIERSTASTDLSVLVEWSASKVIWLQKDGARILEISIALVPKPK